MPKVNFYLMKQSDEAARSVLACRLAEKLYKQNRLVHVHVASDESAREFEQLMWTFSLESFIPHALCTDPSRESGTVMIGWDQHAPASGDLINLTDALPPNHARLDMIAELVVNDELAKAQSRQLWNTYKQLGYELQHHQL
jgi:DNA polymerase III subunit chi